MRRVLVPTVSTWILTEARLESVYARLPIPVQNAACWYYGRRQARIRFSDVFHSRLAQLLESEHWTSSEIAAHQDEHLRALVDHCYRTVPFYRERMLESGLRPGDIQTRADLEKLPFLTKEDIRHNVERLLSTEARRRELVPRKTSGTTGKSLRFYASKAAIAFQWAVWWRHRKRFGLDWWMLHANFTPRPIVPAAQSRPPYWRWSRPLRQVHLNVHHFTPAKIRSVLDFLDRHHLDFYVGYPSVLYVLALTAREAGLELESRPRVVVSGAENLLAHQRREIEQFTGAVVTDHYGMTEGCGHAAQCPHGRYHEDIEFGILECLDPVDLGDGTVRGRIVCTGFADRAFPFIRYQTGDVGVWATDPCPCGRASRTLVRVEGRAQDYVVTPEGRRVMRFDIVFRETENVKESQVVQERRGEVTVRIVRRAAYTKKDEDFVAREIARLVSPTLKVRFEYVPEIERETGGKFRAVKSFLGSDAAELEPSGGRVARAL